MDERVQQRVMHLFAKATALLEDAHTAAATGQSSRLSMRRYRKAADELRSAGTQLAILATAIDKVLGPRHTGSL